MTYIKSSDGTTIDKRMRERPAKHWQAHDGSKGEWVEVTDDNAEQLGYHELVEVARPGAPNEWDSVSREIVHDGDRFTEQWTVTEGKEPLTSRTGIDSFKDLEGEAAVSLGIMALDMEAVRKSLGYLLRGSVEIKAAETVEAKMAKVIELLEGFPEAFQLIDATAVIDLQLIDNDPDVRPELMVMRVKDKQAKAEAFLATDAGKQYAAAKAAELKQ